MKILDTTLREGELNSGVYFTTNKIETIGSSLAKLGTPRIEVSVVYPQRGGNIKEIKKALDNIQGSYPKSMFIVQCRALQQDIEIAQQMETTGCGVYIAISKIHRMNKLGGISVEDTISRLSDAISSLKEQGFAYRRAVLEDASRFFSQYKAKEDNLDILKKIIKAVDEAGATTISLPDTAGLLEESNALKMLQFASEITEKELSAHFHNDYGNALSNTKNVIKEGLAVEPHVSVFGLGAGAGISDHYELSANLMDNLDIETGENRSYFKTLYKKFQEVTKIPIPWNHPLSDFARTEKAGTHQAQQLIDPEGYVPKKKLYNDFDNQIILDVGRSSSGHLIKKMLEGYDLDDQTILDIITLISRRSTLFNRKLYNIEIKNLVKDISNINLPTALISQYIGPEKAFYLLKVKPQNTSEITEKLEKINGAIRVLETYGNFDIIIEAYNDKNTQKAIENIVGENIVEISPLIVG